MNETVPEINIEIMELSDALINVLLHAMLIIQLGIVSDSVPMELMLLPREQIELVWDNVQLGFMQIKRQNFASLSVIWVLYYGQTIQLGNA